MTKIIVPEKSYNMAKGFLAGAGVVALLGGLFFAGYARNNVPSLNQVQRLGVTYQRSVLSRQMLNELYQEFRRDYRDNDILSAANDIRNMLERGSGGNEIRNYFANFEERRGSMRAVNALLIASKPSGVPIPADFQYEDYLIAYFKESGVDASSLTPQELGEIRFGRRLDSSFFDFSNPLGIGFFIVHSIAKDLAPSDFERGMTTYAAAQRGIGFLDSFKNANGHYPRNVQEYEQAREYVLREEQLRPSPSLDMSDYTRTESPSGTVESRSFELGDAQGDPRSSNSQPRVDENQQRRERAQQMDEDTRRGIGQLFDALKNPPKKPPQN